MTSIQPDKRGPKRYANQAHCVRDDGRQEEPPLSVAEVAHALGVSPDVVRATIRKGRLRAGKVGGHWRIRRRDLTEYMMALFERG